MLYKCSLFNIYLYIVNSLETEPLLYFISNMLCSSYFNILYDLSRLWLLTGEECCLQVQRGQYNVKVSLIHRGTCSNPDILINNQYFGQYFRGTYVRWCTCGSQCGAFQGCVLGQPGV